MGHCRTRGFTLIELVVAMTLGIILLGALYQMFLNLRKSYSLQGDSAYLQQEVRACEYLMVRELRMAGYKVKGVDIKVDVPGTVFFNGVYEAFEEAGPSSVAFTTDVDGDGVTETIRYFLKGEALMREMWRWDKVGNRWKKSGGARALADSGYHLDFSYGVLSGEEGLNNGLDDDGDSAVDEEGEIFFTSLPSQEERVYIGLVRFMITAKSSRPDSCYTHPVFGDHFRRIVLSSTVQIRNRVR